MTSKNLSHCCTTGSIHEGKTKGEIKNIGNISTYFAYPPNKSTTDALIILTDIIGHKLINVQLLADQFAANGYFVVIPDLFNGDSVPINRPEGFNVMDWVKNHTPVATDPIITTVIKELRETFGVKRLGGIGYCFGGKYVCRFLKPGQLDVGFMAHPGMVDAEELAGIQGPLSIAAAIRDHIFTTANRRESEDILGKLDYPYQINAFSDVEHGFAVRCDLSKPRLKYAKEQAFIQAVEWFKEYLNKM